MRLALNDQKKYKVLVNKGTRFYPSSFEKDYNQVTAILPFKVYGDRLELFVILPVAYISKSFA